MSLNITNRYSFKTEKTRGLLLITAIFFFVTKKIDIDDPGNRDGFAIFSFDKKWETLG